MVIEMILITCLVCFSVKVFWQFVKFFELSSGYFNWFILTTFEPRLFFKIIFSFQIKEFLFYKINTLTEIYSTEFIIIPIRIRWGFFAILFICIFVCMSVLLCGHLCAKGVHCSWKPEEEVGSSN